MRVRNFQLECNCTGPTLEPASTRARTAPPTGTRCLPVLAPLFLHPNIWNFIIRTGNGDHIIKREYQSSFMWLEEKKEKPLIPRFLTARSFQFCRSQLTAVQKRHQFALVSDWAVHTKLSKLCSKLLVGKGRADTVSGKNVNACPAPAQLRCHSEGL